MWSLRKGRICRKTHNQGRMHENDMVPLSADEEYERSL